MKIEIRNLSKEFDKPILKGVNFSDSVSSLAIIGPSGDGKSTLLRILGGLLTPTDGSVYLEDMPVIFEENALAWHRKNIGFVFQQDGLFKHMTALQNITVPLVQVHKLDAHQAEQTAYELLARFGISDTAAKKPAQLSGGQKQRIAIARAIAPRPKLLLLDEPTSALDPEYTTEVLDMINELKSDGIDFIIVTHEMGFARHACDKAAFLYDGRIFEYGDSEELFAAPKTEELQRFFSKLLEWKV